MNTPPVTWLLPVRDAMPYLTETLASIAAQRYPEHRILAWDNGSTDGSAEELRRWIPATIPGRVVTDRPMGLGAALACMVQEADTELCARIDGDDITEPDRLSKQVAFMQRHPKVVLVGSGFTVMNRAGGDRQPICPPNLTDPQVRWALRRGNAIHHPTVMFRRSAILSAGNYRDRTPGQDHDLWIRLGQIGRMVNLPDILLHYRVHDASITRRHHESAAAVAEQIVAEHDALLYPGLTPFEAERLHDLLADSHRLDVRFHDCTALVKTALRIARISGDPPWHFLGSDRYRHQLSNLLVRWIKTRPGMRPLWPMFRRLRLGLRVG